MGHFLKHYEQYDSINAIVKDPYGPALAYAQDMKYVDWLNFQIKNFVIRQIVLSHPVNIRIGDKKIPLVHPLSKIPLRFQDFVVDRSGPKFSGYLDVKTGTEYIQPPKTKTELDKIVAEHLVKLKSYCDTHNILMPPEHIATDALSVFYKNHQNQRKLSDFDLQAIDIRVFKDAVIEAVKQELTKEQSIKLMQNLELCNVIAETLWQTGGIIDMKLVVEYLESPLPPSITYTQRVLASMQAPHGKDEAVNPTTSTYPFTHLLLDDVGKAVRRAYLSFYESHGFMPPNFYKVTSSGVPDVFYGLGIAFHEAVIESIGDNGQLNFSIDKEDTEIGDIICDNRSLFGDFLSNYQLLEVGIANLQKAGITSRTIKLAMNGIKQSPSVDQEMVSTFFRHLKQSEHISTAERVVISREADRFSENVRLRDTGLMFEEAGKKEGQSQWFKDKGKKDKLIGNISDTGQFLKGVKTKLEGIVELKQVLHAKIHQQMTMLTTLISVTRWGVNVDNYMTLGDTQLAVSPEMFMESLNARSYQADNSSGIRAALGWANISRDEAIRRMEDYREGFLPVWQFIHKNPNFFQKVQDVKLAQEALISAQEKGTLLEKAEARNELLHATTGLMSELKVILMYQTPELYQKLEEYCPIKEPNGVAKILRKQVLEAIYFGMKREKLAHTAAKKTVDKEPEQVILPQTELAQEPNTALYHGFFRPKPFDDDAIIQPSISIKVRG